MASARRRILFVLPALDGGGAERVVLQLATAFLDSATWCPVLALTTDRIGAHESACPPALAVVRLKASHVRAAMPALLRLIRRMRPQVVFGTLDHLNAALGLIAPFLPRGTRLVLRATSLRALESGGLRAMLGWAFRRADLVIFQSEAMRERLTTGLRLPTLPSVVMENPLDFEGIATLCREPAPQLWSPAAVTRLIAAGRLTPAKGFDLIVDAMEDLPADTHLAILGTGGEEMALRARIAAKGLADRVTLAGYRQNPYAYFAGADAFVLSSRVEGFPNVVLEALACGTPVIATPLPGLAGIAGCGLARAISSSALAEAITDFRNHPHRADPAALRAAHDLQALRRRYEQLFDRLADGRTAHAPDLHA